MLSTLSTLSTLMRMIIVRWSRVSREGGDIFSIVPAYTFYEETTTQVRPHVRHTHPVRPPLLRAACKLARQLQSIHADQSSA